MNEGPTWVYIAKSVCAAVLSLYVAMRLELPSPRTAMTTVFIVMTPQSGMVVAKSFYRLLGTLVGVTVTLTLISLFSQTRELFLLSVAIWIGICTAGSARNRNFRSYGFVLAGYTAALVGVPNAEIPLGAFDAGVTRALEVSLGIICAALISAVVFPRYSSSLLRQQLRTRFADFVAFVHDATRGTLARTAIEGRNMRFIADVVGLEALRSYSIFEDPLSRLLGGRVAQLNSESMAASTRLHALHQLLNRARTQPAADAAQAAVGATEHGSKAGNAAAEATAESNDIVATLTPYLTELSEQLTLAGEPVRDATGAVIVARQLEAFKRALPARVHRTRAAHVAALTPSEQLDFDTATELLYRFVDDMHAYTLTYASLKSSTAPQAATPAATPGSATGTQRVSPKAGESNESRESRYYRYVPKTNGLMALIAGARAAVTMLIVSAFWIGASWPSGAFATLGAGTICALISASPQPTRAAWQMTVGTTIAVIAGYFVTFHVFAVRQGFFLMSTGLLPFLMLGAWMTTQRKWGAAGLGYCIFFCFLAGPDNLTVYDPLTYINNGVALIVSLLVSTVAFGTLLPPTTRWLLQRMQADLRKQVIMASFGRRRGLAHRFDSGTRDYMFQIGALTAEKPQLQREMLGWMFSVLEIGHAMIELRGEFDTLPLALRNDPRYRADSAWRVSIRAIREALVVLFTSPSALHWTRAVELSSHAITYTQQMLDEPGEHRHDGAIQGERTRVRRVLSYLHFIRTALLDEHSPLAAYSTLRGTAHDAALKRPRTPL